MERNHSPSPAELVATALAGAAQRAAYLPGARLDAELRLLRDLDLAYPGRVDREAATMLDQLVRAGWEGGWQPIDLVEHARRNVTGDARAYLVDAIAVEHRAYASAAVDPRWQGQLDDIGARVWWPDGRPHLAEWSRRHGVLRLDTFRVAITVAGFLMRLPRLPRLLPLPGAATNRTPAGQAATAGIDEKALARIRALLAKAESTEFPDEAEALSAKAQALMAKFSLDRALVDAADTADLAGTSGALVAEAAARRIWVEAPYVSAKTRLVHEVAAANHCRTVTYDKLGFITVLGAHTDLELVELLATSLLLQASRAMVAAGRRVSRTRSFRQSFLVSYAIRIGERLQAATRATEQAVDQAQAGRLLPVLARRGEAVDALFTELFPRTVRRGVSVSNAEGWTAGRTAADLATLDAQQAIG